MTQRNYIIEYTVKDKRGVVLKSGKMKTKSKVDSSMEAQIEFEKFLKRRYATFGQLIVHNCSEEPDVFGMFGDIFETNNPFNL